MVIYKITNLVTGKIYVGQDSNNNPNYLGSGNLIIQSIKKHGRENFNREVLEQCQDFQSLNEREIFWISELNSTDHTVGYNESYLVMSLSNRIDYLLNNLQN